MRNPLPAFALSAAIFGVTTHADEPWDLNGSVEIQGTKSFEDGFKGDNLDQLWGRMNLGAEYKDSVWATKFSLRLYPEGFGFDPVVGATFDTSARALSTKTQSLALVQVMEAWMQADFGPFQTRAGRIKTSETHSAVFGNYIDQGAGPKFKSRLAYHNATEFLSSSNGGIESSMMLGVSDPNLNRGFLRIVEKWTSPGGLSLMGGFKSNIFDLVYDMDADILNRVVFSPAYSLPNGVKVYAEGAWQQVSGKDDEIPVMGGVSFGIKKVVDLVSLEAEFLSDRKAGGEDKPVLLHWHMARKFLKRLKVEASLHSDPSAPDFEDMSGSLRVSGPFH